MMDPWSRSIAPLEANIQRLQRVVDRLVTPKGHVLPPLLGISQESHQTVSVAPKDRAEAPAQSHSGVRLTEVEASEHLLHTQPDLQLQALPDSASSACGSLETPLPSEPPSRAVPERKATDHALVRFWRRLLG